MLAVEAGAEAPKAKPASLGIAECDRYIENYERCEPTLRPRIEAGDMIEPRNERVRLQFLLKNQPGPDYGHTCAVLDRELSKICGGSTR